MLDYTTKIINEFSVRVEPRNGFYMLESKPSTYYLKPTTY